MVHHHHHHHHHTLQTNTYTHARAHAHIWSALNHNLIQSIMNQRTNPNMRNLIYFRKAKYKNADSFQARWGFSLLSPIKLNELILKLTLSDFVMIYTCRRLRTFAFVYVNLLLLDLTWLQSLFYDILLTNCYRISFGGCCFFTRFCCRCFCCCLSIPFSYARDFAIILIDLHFYLFGPLERS